MTENNTEAMTIFYDLKQGDFIVLPSLSSRSN